MVNEYADPREAPVRERLEEGDTGGAATEILRVYGPEIFGFLLGVHRREEDANDVFSIWSEQVWRTLPSFAWRCSLRTWVYILARSASSRFRRDEARKAPRGVPLSDCSKLREMEAKVRTETLSYLRSERKEAVAQLRAALSKEDQELLLLRVDRGLAFSELARIFLGGEEAGSAEAVAREAARLRKRFQLVKQELLALGKARGLFKTDGR
jgi:RNA polymerase sigma-70 factor, ECF subfamily